MKTIVRYFCWFLLVGAVSATARQTVQAQTTLATDGCPGWIASADYLFWSVRDMSAQYGITDIGGVQDRGAVGDVLSIGTDYESGLRFAIGKRLGACVGGPELMFRMTDFDSNETETYAGPLRATFVSADNSENDDSDNINTLGVETIFPDDRATSAAANLHFSYNVYDFEIAQPLIMSDHLTLRLSGIGRAVDIEQAFSVTYTGGDFATVFTPFRNSDFVGGGMLIGTELAWYVVDTLTIDFGAKLGALGGTVDTRVFIPDDEPGVPTDVTYSERRITSVLEMKIGITYKRPIRQYLVMGSVGYEMTQLFNLSDSRNFTESHQEGNNTHLIGDISLDGLYARAGVEF